MPTAEATVATDRASRYLVQLCRHASQIGRTMPAKIAAEWSESDGTIGVDGATCTMLATPDALLMLAEAYYDDKLLRLKETITKNLTRFSRREPLTVRWQRAGETPIQAPHRGRRRTIVLVGAGILAVAAHLLLGATVLAAPA